MKKAIVISDALELMCNTPNAQYELSAYLEKKHNFSDGDSYMLLKYMQENDLIFSPHAGSYMITTKGYDIQRDKGYVEYIKEWRAEEALRKEANLASLTMKIYNKKTRYWSVSIAGASLIVAVIALIKNLL